MLNINPVKIKSLNCSLLQIHVNKESQISHYKDKILDLINIGISDKSLVLLFEKEFLLFEMENFINDFQSIINKLNIQIHSIAKNDFINVPNVLNIPVVDYSNCKTHITMQPNSSLIIDNPIRSGMKISHNSDIIVTSFVSNGAEVISTGNIHIYGELKGRAIAGCDGNKNAKIFALKFCPELISIAGIYRVIDTKLPDSLQQKPVMVGLDEKLRLKIIAIN